MPVGHRHWYSVPFPRAFVHTITLLAGHQTAKLDKKLERLSVVSEEKKAQRKKKRKDSERDVESESHAPNDEASEDQQQPPPKVSQGTLPLPPSLDSSYP